MDCQTYQDLVAAHVDGVLTDEERQAVEIHLGLCEQCRHLFVEQQQFQAAFQAHQYIIPVPADVEQRLRIALAAERESERPVWERLREWSSTTSLVPRFALGLAAVGLLLALLLPRLFPTARAPDMLAQAVHSYEKVVEDRPTLDYPIDEPHKLQTVLNRSGQLDFVTHVLDLRPAGLQLRGGTIGRYEDRPVAMAIYDGEDGHVLCLRQHGRMPPLPPDAERVQNSYLYTQSGHTIFFTQFPDHFCILVSNLSPEVFLRRLASLPPS